MPLKSATYNKSILYACMNADLCHRHGLFQRRVTRFCKQRGDSKCQPSSPTAQRRSSLQWRMQQDVEFNHQHKSTGAGFYFRTARLDGDLRRQQMPEVETHKMTVAELKAALERLGVENRSGLKADLVTRLEEARSKEQAPQRGMLIALYFHQKNT